MESFTSILRLIGEFFVYAVSGLAAAYYFYYHKQKDLPGGFWVATLIAVIGSVLVVMLTGIDSWFMRIVSWLMTPKFDDVLLVRINIITAVLGAFLFVFILNKINQNRTRR